jgi:hypothetical protein
MDSRSSRCAPRGWFTLVGASLAACIGLVMTPPAHAAEISPILLTKVATTTVPNDLIVSSNGRALYAISSTGRLTAYDITGPLPVESSSLLIGNAIANAYFTTGPTPGHVYVYGQQAAPKSGYNNFLFDVDPASNSTVSSVYIDAGGLSSPPIPANLPTVNVPLGQPITGVVVADLTGRYILAATEGDEMLVIDTSANQVTGAIRAGNGPLITRALDSSNRLYVSNGSPEIRVINLSLLGSLPPPPTGVSAQAASTTSAAVRWAAPSPASPATAGNEVTGYIVTASPGNRTCFTSGLTCTVDKLTRGQKYTFSVQSENAMARSVRVNSAPALALQKATRCSRGGPCTIGEVGPGGGIVFALPTTKGNASKKTYEAAPNSWSGGSQDPALEWSQALTASAAYQGGQVTGWKLPSIAELGWLYKQRATVGGFAPTRYWSSTARNEFMADNYFFNTGRRGEYGKDSAFLVRPIRRF